MSGFSERSELVGLLVDSGLLEQSAAVKWTGSTHIKKVFALCERIVLYIKTATVRTRKPSYYVLVYSRCQCTTMYMLYIQCANVHVHVYAHSVVVICNVFVGKKFSSRRK